MSLSVAHLGHGMGAELEHKDWADISHDELNALKPFYPLLQGEITILWKSPRPFSSAMLIRVNHTSYFIKRSHGSFRSVEDLLQEHRFIRHLFIKGMDVPHLIESVSGKTAIALGAWSYEVHHKAKGDDVYINQLSWKPFFYPQHAAKAGKTLAELHHAAQNFPILHGRSAQYLVSNQKLLDSDDIQSAIQHRIQHSPELRTYFADKIFDEIVLEQLSGVHQQIKTVFHQAKNIWTHNDLHASNLLWSNSGVDAEISSIIDFGLSDRNSAVYDLAVAIERNFIDWLALTENSELTIDYLGLKAFLQAYVAHSSLNHQEYLILPDLLKIVHVDFAFSELEYFVGITRNLKHADAAYYDWLISHTAWFFSQQGEHFIQILSDMLTKILSPKEF